MAEKARLTFLGTGCAIPTKRRAHPAVLLSYKNENILVDCGEGVQRQIRIAKINPCSIIKIFITHWHGDHTLGIPGLVQTLELNGYNKQLDIYGPKGTKMFMDLYLRLFVHPNSINIQVHEIQTGKFFENEDIQLEAEQMNHNTPTFSYSFIIKEKSRLDKKKLSKLKIPNGPLIGELKQGKTILFNGKKIDGNRLLYKEEGKKISFILDTAINENCRKIAHNADLLISEATFSQDEEENAKMTFHLTSKQAAEIAKKANAKKLILMHLSQRFEKDPSKLLKEAKSVFKNTILAEDFMKLEI
jgi:ribonuclease Z